MIDRSKLVFQNKNFKVVDGAAGITFDFVVFDNFAEINMKKISTEFVVNGDGSADGCGFAHDIGGGYFGFGYSDGSGDDYGDGDGYGDGSGPGYVDGSGYGYGDGSGYGYENGSGRG